EKVNEELGRQQRVSAFRRDPVRWAEYMLGSETYIWSKQRDILDSVMVHKNTAVKAGHGVGKSYISALMVCHWIDVNYPNCFVPLQRLLCPRSRPFCGVRSSDCTQLSKSGTTRDLLTTNCP